MRGERNSPSDHRSNRTMMTPEQFKTHHSTPIPSSIEDSEIEKRIDEALRNAQPGQEIVSVNFKNGGAANRAAQLYGEHWECTVDRGAIEVRVPRTGRVTRKPDAPIRPRM